MYVHNPGGQQVAVIDPKGNTSQSIFNLAGQEVEAIDALGHATFFGLDSLGRAISTTDPDGNISVKIFDAAGNDVENIDANGNPSYSYFNPDNQLLMSVDGLSRKKGSGKVFEEEMVSVYFKLGKKGHSLFQRKKNVSVKNSKKDFPYPKK